LHTWNVLAEDPLLSVIVPVFNEAHHIDAVLERICRVAVHKELIVVDDASSDGSWERLVALQRHYEGASDCKWQLIRLPFNRGKGFAVRVGIAAAAGKVVLIQDGDMEYDPADYPALISPIFAGKTRVVYGNRFGCGSKASYRWHRYGNGLLTVTGNWLLGGQLSDLHTGYKVFDAELLRSLSLKEDRFGFDSEITAALCKLGEVILEVPVSYSPRSYAQGKKIGARGLLDTLRVYCHFGIRRRLQMVWT
jgi:glycosyltransferase involved in cell wall biosynthesis